ncbi:MAG: hypothetical protein ACOYN0_08360 [Phycisphaerales bacterium]
MSDAPAPKLCSICGIDCSAKKRSKDAQGRYVCADCLQQATQARSAQASPAPAAGGVALRKAAEETETDNSFLLDIPVGAPPKKDEPVKPCPSCFKPMPENSMVCMTCGFNAKTGEQLKVRVLKAKEENVANTDRQKGYSAIADVPDWAWCLGALAVGAIPIAAGVAIQNPTLLAVGVGGMVLCCLVTEILMMVNAFRSSLGEGLLYLLLPVVAVGYLYKWYYALFVCENSGLKTVWVLNWVVVLAFLVILGFNPELLEFPEN